MFGIRKLVVFAEEVFSDGGRRDGDPLRKAAAVAVFANPYAGRGFSEDLNDLVAPSAELGKLLGERAAAALGAPVESYGKAAVVGLGGEQEHAVACKTSVFGDAFREAIGGAEAWLPSVSKRSGPGDQVDVPLCFKDEVWVRSHYDSIAITLHDAPHSHEIALICAVASRGRLNHRLGGMTKPAVTSRRRKRDE
jgi:Amino acid synthesis